MTEAQRAHLERRLLRERERALRMLAQFEEMAMIAPQGDDGELTNYPLHLADEGTDTLEQETGFLLRSKEGRLLYWIDDALRTLYREPERYGRCQSCGREIAFERLDIVPWTRLCIECQRREEQRLSEAA
ncbi:MAG TPA: TraR/DksA C4-type zinc finger protein [Longimicrobiales bacterium]|nr:TraR/DksA C4-type zinc finger protein [Longimicrobiales bacterium]